MIAIPNMSKPKNCRTCKFKSNKEGECWFVHYDSNCPLIEIIRCGECKYYSNNTEKKNYIIGCCIRTNCIPPMKETDFCSYGERRNEI